MIKPILSTVAPRVFSPTTDSILQLTDEIEVLLRRESPAKVRLDGYGCQDALSHIAATMADQVSSGQLHLGNALPLETTPHVTIITNPKYRYSHAIAKKLHEFDFDIILRLSPWGRDDFIEYLLAEHPKQCASVMDRLKGRDTSFASGSPMVWRIILDRMAGDQSSSDPEAIILSEVHLRLNNPSLAKAIADRMIFPPGNPYGSETRGVFGHPPGVDSSAFHNVFFDWSQSSASDLLVHESVQIPFALERLKERMRGSISELNLLMRYHFRPGMLRRIAKEIAGEKTVHDKLNQLFKHNRPRTTANCASLLAAVDPKWRPRGKELDLHDADLKGVEWVDVNLSRSSLVRANFSNADLSGAQLRSCRLAMANFENARLCHVDLSSPEHERALATELNSGESLLSKAREKIDSIRRKKKKPNRDHQGSRRNQKDKTDSARMQRAFNQFLRVNFQAADLSDSVLSGSQFSEANFSGANLVRVTANRTAFYRSALSDANWSDGDFTESWFKELDMSRLTMDGCVMVHCWFENVSFEGLTAQDVDFSRATMNASIWTESRLQECNFLDAQISNARMAEIEWEHCDLRGADLRGCTFHMGSTRSGIVNSPYPSHGTRTGFYTDDYLDQHFQAPETIRKASLYGCDIRGANIHGVDFYLVDLREAKFDPDQREQLIATGAILDDDT